MTATVRTVPTGDLGLDVLLGGGWRLVKRLDDTEASTTVVVRGSSGAGKTILGVHVALELAGALGGDVVVGCVEILPTEYVAQLESARPSLSSDRIAILPTATVSTDGPRVYVGLMLDLDPDQPDLNASLRALRDTCAATGGKPVVFVVDSLIEGYGIGSSAPRIAVDDCMKFAAKHGVSLVLCEEVVSDAPSPWVFAADTVLQVGVESRERGRWIEVKKHRFGPSATGRHEFDLVDVAKRPMAFPEAHAWRTLGHVTFGSGGRPPRCEAPALVFAEANNTSSPTGFRGRAVVVAAPSERIARFVAMTLRPAEGDWPFDQFLELDPTALSSDFFGPAASDKISSPVWFFPVHRGPNWFLSTAITRLRGTPERGRAALVVGDLRHVLFSSNAEAWRDAIETLSMVAIEMRPSATLVFCLGEIRGDAIEWLRLQRNADVCITAYENSQDIRAGVVARDEANTLEATWQRHVHLPRADAYLRARTRAGRS